MLAAQTITSIYDAAFSDKHWRRSLDVCAAAASAKAAMLYEFPSLRQVNYTLEATSSAFLSAKKQLAEYNNLLAEGKDSGYDQEGLGATHRAATYEVLLDSDIWQIDDDYLLRPEVQIALDAPGTLRRSLINLTDDPTVYSGAIFLYGREFDAKMPTFTRDIGAQLAPHLAKAIELNRLTSDLRRKYNAALSVLDKIETGVFILVENGEVILKNRGATDILDESDGLVLNKGNVLACKSSKADAALRDAASNLSRTAIGDNDETSRFLEIPRPGCGQPLLAVLSPLRDANIELDKELSGTLLTLIDPLKPTMVNPETLAKAYGLTEAEKRLSTLLVTGMTNQEMAEQLDVSPETIKSHLSSIYSKCGCRNRLAFIWRLFQFAPPII